MAVKHMYCLCNSELFQIQGTDIGEGQTVNWSSMYGLTTKTLIFMNSQEN